MRITLRGQGEEIVRAALARGECRSAEEFVERALEDYVARSVRERRERCERAAEAAASLRRIRLGARLDGLSLRDLIDEGRHV